MEAAERAGVEFPAQPTLIPFHERRALVGALVPTEVTDEHHAHLYLEETLVPRWLVALARNFPVTIHRPERYMFGCTPFGFLLPSDESSKSGVVVEQPWKQEDGTTARECSPTDVGE